QQRRNGKNVGHRQGAGKEELQINVRAYLREEVSWRWRADSCRGGLRGPVGPVALLLPGGGQGRKPLLPRDLHPGTGVTWPQGHGATLRATTPARLSKRAALTRDNPHIASGRGAWPVTP